MREVRRSPLWQQALLGLQAPSVSLFGFPAPPAAPSGFFVSATGGTGAGTIADPWSWAYAIGTAVGTAQGDGKLPATGATVWVRGGTYTNKAITLTAHGSEDTIGSAQNTAGTYVVVDTSNMANGDAALLRAKRRALSVGSIGIVYEASFQNAQADPVKISIPVPLPNNCAAEMKANSATSRHAWMDFGSAGFVRVVRRPE